MGAGVARGEGGLLGLLPRLYRCCHRSATVTTAATATVDIATAASAATITAARHRAYKPMRT
jgi:hypothetical protein